MPLQFGQIFTPDTKGRGRPPARVRYIFPGFAGGAVQDRRQVNRGVNTGLGFGADLSAFAGAMNPFSGLRLMDRIGNIFSGNGAWGFWGNDPRGGLGGGLGSNTPSGRDKPGPGGLVR